MSKIQFYVDENIKTGTHSFFAKTKPYQRLEFDEVAESACQGTSIEPEIMKSAVDLYMKKAQELLKQGNRVALGDKFITLVPSVKCSVKDTLNQDGTVKTAATAAMVKPQKKDAIIGATVSTVFSDEFRQSVQWQRIDKQGNVLPDSGEETVDTGTDDQQGGGEGGESTDPNE
jgi:hypothetical protein